MEREAELHHYLVRTTRLYHQSLVWQAALDIYAGATRAGRHDSEIQRAIAAFARFMKHGPRDKAGDDV